MTTTKNGTAVRPGSANAPAVRPPASTPAAGSAPASGSAPATGAAAAAPGRLARTFATTPSRLRLLLVLTILAALLSGYAGIQAGSLQSAATSQARDEAAQVVGVQDLRNQLVTADAIASNAFLVGGLEPTDQRADYDAAIEEASRLVATLSGSSTADSTILASVSTGIATYTGLVEQARANNRQGFPVGSAYLGQASTLLASEILPQLETIVATSADRVAGSFATAKAALWLLGISVLALVLLVAAQLWLTRRTHRYLHPGLVVSTAIVLVLGVGGAIVFGSTASTVQSVRETSYAATLAVSQATTSVIDAKSTESFTLIQRGSGQTLEADFDASIADATSRLDTAADRGIIGSELTALLDTWIDRHDEIRAADDAGDWDGAVGLAIESGEGTADAAFQAYTGAAAEEIEAAATTTSDDLALAGTLSLLAGWVLLLGGLAAAVFAFRGVSVRLREYR